MTVNLMIKTYEKANKIKWASNIENNGLKCIKI